MPLKDPVKRSKYQSEWMQRRRIEWIMANGPCRRCGSTINLEVDHIDPREKVDHRIWGQSQERRDAELAKCQVLCRQCHWAKTGEDNGWHKHGTFGVYRNQRCRCELCVTFVREFYRRKRAQK